MITYVIIGDDLAPHYFKINKDDGKITITTDIKNDVVTDYQVHRVHLFYVFPFVGSWLNASMMLFIFKRRDTVLHKIVLVSTV